MVDTIFPDISENQEVVDVAAVRRSGVDAIGIRITYGARPDNTMPDRRNQVRAANFRAVLWYLFLRHSQDVKAQVETAISVIPTLQNGECMFVDWEADLDKIAPTVSQRDTALQLLDNHYGRATGLYCSASNAPQLHRPLWVADYEVQKEPAVQHIAWQYTNGIYKSGKYIPVDFASIGVCDTSVFHGTAEQLAVALGAGTTTSIQKNQTLEEDDMSAELTIVWPDGSKTVGAKDGTIFNADSPFFGTMLDLPPRQKQDWTEAKALTPVDITDKNAGYVFHNANGSKYAFTPAEWAIIQAKHQRAG